MCVNRTIKNRNQIWFYGLFVLTFLLLHRSSGHSLQWPGMLLQHWCLPWQKSQSMGYSLLRHTMPEPFSRIPAMEFKALSSYPSQNRIVILIIKINKNILREAKTLKSFTTPHSHKKLLVAKKLVINYRNLFLFPFKHTSGKTIQWNLFLRKQIIPG